MKKVAVCILVLSMLMGLSGCLSALLFERDYRFMNEESEITTIEIVEIDPEAPNSEGEIIQATVGSVADVDAFLSEFSNLTCHETPIFASPNYFFESGLVIKFVYQNGDYELVGPHAQGHYTNGKGYNNYKGFFSFEDDEFTKLLEKYTT